MISHKTITSATTTKYITLGLITDSDAD